MIFKPRKILRLINTRICFIRFSLRKFFWGFETANQLVSNINKQSLMFILIKNGASIGKDCDIETGMIFHNCKDFTNLIIGDRCHIGKNCFFDLRDKIIIGNNVVISMQCTFITHIDMSNSSLTNIYTPKQEKITIDNDVYIGAGSQVLMGVTIGKKGFVAAKSLVTNIIEPYTLVGGVPAKVIKKINGA